MSPAEMKALAVRSLEMWASDNTDTPEQVFAERYANHQASDVRGGVQTLDLESWKQLVGTYRRAFSDATVRILMQIAEDDRVATRWQFSVVHTGAFMGETPTGKPLTWTGVQIDRFENGKIAESWVDWDKFGFMQGIGLID